MDQRPVLRAHRQTSVYALLVENSTFPNSACQSDHCSLLERQVSSQLFAFQTTAPAGCWSGHARRFTNPHNRQITCSQSFLKFQAPAPLLEMTSFHACLCGSKDLLSDTHSSVASWIAPLHTNRCCSPVRRSAFLDKSVMPSDEDRGLVSMVPTCSAPPGDDLEVADRCTSDQGHPVGPCRHQIPDELRGTGRYLAATHGSAHVVLGDRIVFPLTEWCVEVSVNHFRCRRLIRHRETRYCLRDFLLSFAAQPFTVALEHLITFSAAMSQGVSELLGA